jgi:hypothetical protein
MTSVTRLFRVFPFVLTICAFSGSLYANELVKAGDPRALFEAGVRARDAGDYDVALRLFRQSNDMYRTESRGALYNMAFCEERLGHTAASYLHYAEFLRDVKDYDSRIRDAKQSMDAMKNAGPWLMFRNIDKLAANSQISVDGVSVGPLATLGKIPAEPGTHAVVVQSPNQADRSLSMNVVQGKTAELDVGPAPPPPPPPPPMPKVRVAGLAIGGLGATSVIAGAITGGLAWQHRQTLDDCREPSIPLCKGSEITDYFNEGKRVSNASTATLIIGGALLATGATMFFWPNAKNKDAAVIPLVAPGSGGFLVQTRF